MSIDNSKDLRKGHRKRLRSRFLEAGREALADYEEAIRLNHADAAAYAMRGSVYQALERYPEAIAYYGEAIRIAPEKADLFAKRGDVFQILGRKQDAQADFEEL